MTSLFTLTCSGGMFFLPPEPETSESESDSESGSDDYVNERPVNTHLSGCSPTLLLLRLLLTLCSSSLSWVTVSSRPDGFPRSSSSVLQQQSGRSHGGRSLQTKTTLIKTTVTLFWRSSSAALLRCGFRPVWHWQAPGSNRAASRGRCHDDWAWVQRSWWGDPLGPRHQQRVLFFMFYFLLNLNKIRSHIFLLLFFFIFNSSWELCCCCCCW